MRMLRIPLIVLLLLAVSCGSGSSRLTSSAPSGPYEFVVTSNVTGGVTLVEANLSSSGNQLNALGPDQVQILSFEKKTWYLNGVCPGNQPGQNSVAASLSGNSVEMTFSEGGYAFGGHGVQTGTSITGNYSVSGSSCADLIGEIGYPPGTDSGGFVGLAVPSLAGTYSGPLTLSHGTDNASFTMTENADHSLTVTAQLTGPVDNGTVILTGSAVGNAMFVSGSVSGQPVTLLGYFDRTGAYAGMPNSMLVFNYETLSKAGLLLGQ